MSSFFPWMGGKSRLAGLICENLADHKCYVEVFCGAANILFSKPRVGTEIINDINSDLINLFRSVRYHYREFVRELTLVTHSRKDYKDFQANPGLTEIQRAARYYLILKASFGGKGGTKCCVLGYGTTGKAHYHRGIFPVINRCHKRLDGVVIENLDFTDLISRYDRPHTLFYCDPPYLNTAGYLASFGIEDHKRLADCLKAIKGKFLLSINSHDAIRRLYKGFNIKELQVRYTVSLDKTDKAQQRGELLIANYPLKKSGS